MLKVTERDIVSLFITQQTGTHVDIATVNGAMLLLKVSFKQQQM